MRVLLWLLLVSTGGADRGKEPTDLLVPHSWQGNPWGPAATAARKSGELPPIPVTPLMKQWDEWGKKVLKPGDILFRRGDARILGGLFPFSRFIANISGSPYSHVGTLAIEDGELIVYDTTKASVRRQPFKIWVLDTVEGGAFGVKRLKPAYRNRIPKVFEYLHKVYEDQVPFDFELSVDDRELYCVEMAEKAFRHAGLVLSEPVLLADMENINQFPLCVLGFTNLTSLKLDQAVFFPGNERHGIWSSPLLETVYETKPKAKTAQPAASPAAKEKDKEKGPKSAAPQPKSVAGRPETPPRN
jgi:Permuted papain-like amidase enzyme, YaeF/YiiX, C92 family